MSTENVTYAFQVAATNGNGFSVFLEPPAVVNLNGSLSVFRSAVRCSAQG
jgi:hypothetical protein